MLPGVALVEPGRACRSLFPPCSSAGFGTLLPALEKGRPGGDRPSTSGIGRESIPALANHEMMRSSSLNEGRLRRRLEMERGAVSVVPSRKRSAGLR